MTSLALVTARAARQRCTPAANAATASTTTGSGAREQPPAPPPPSAAAAVVTRATITPPSTTSTRTVEDGRRDSWTRSRRARVHRPLRVRHYPRGGDRARLGDRRVHGAAGVLRLPAGVHRRRAVAGRLRRRRVPRHPRWRRCCSARAPTRPTRRCSACSARCWPAGCWPAAWRVWAPGSARRCAIPGLRTVDGLLGAALTACVALGVAWIVGAVALQASGSRAAARATSSARPSCASSTRLLPPSGPILNALARFDPLPSVHGPAADVAGARRAASCAAPACAAAAPQRGAGVRHRLRARRRGQRLGGGARDLVVTNAHVVAGESDTDGPDRRRRAPGTPAAVLVFDVHDDIADPARARAGAARRWRPRRQPRLGHRGGDPRLSARRRLRRRAGPARADRDGRDPGRLRRRATCCARITALRGRVRPGNSGGPMVDGARPGAGDRVRGAHRHRATPGGFAVPNGRRARHAAAPSATGRPRPGASATGPLRRLDHVAHLSAGAGAPVTERQTPWAGGGLRRRPPSGVDCPRTLLGHLRHHIQLQRPQELWVVMCEVLLRRLEELLLGRPASCAPHSQ